MYDTFDNTYQATIGATTMSGVEVKINPHRDRLSIKDHVLGGSNGTIAALGYWYVIPLTCLTGLRSRLAGWVRGFCALVIADQ